MRFAHVLPYIKRGLRCKAREKIHGGQFQIAVDFINQLTVESPVLSALIYTVFYHQSAGWPRWSQGSLPDITVTLVCLVWQESQKNSLPPVLQEPGGSKETDFFSASLSE